MKICFRGQKNCQQNAENKLKFMPLFGAASQVGVPTMRRFPYLNISFLSIMMYLISKLLGIVNELILSVFTVTIIVKFTDILAKIVVISISMVVNFKVMKCVKI